MNVVQDAYEQAIATTDLDDFTVDAAASRLNGRSEIVITAVGKSFFVAQRGAATMRSLGLHATALHATELLHGDLGHVRANTLVIALSNSGTTAEVLAAVDHCLRRPLVEVIAVTPFGTPLSDRADLTLRTPINLTEGNAVRAPMASCVVQSLWLDVITEQATRTSVNDTRFEANHPGGAIGARYGR